MMKCSFSSIITLSNIRSEVSAALWKSASNLASTDSPNPTDFLLI